jgi:hypothetical protein
MSNSINANQIKIELNIVITEADKVEPLLAKRLRQFSRWIKDKKDGLLTKKKLVLDLIIEIIQDAKLWIEIQDFDPEERAEFYNEAGFTASEKYWYETLFPEWFMNQDPKLSIWTKKLMADEFPRSDQEIIDKFIWEFNRLGKPSLYRYILDLSMATDLVIHNQLGKPLAVQMTSSNPDLLGQKQSEWEKTLIYWKVPRGVLFSHFTSHPVGKSVEILLKHADTLENGCYVMGISKST